MGWLNQGIPASLPDAPSDGNQYARKNGGWEEIEAGAELTVLDETTSLGTVDTIKFAGAGVTATKAGTVATVTIPGGGAGAVEVFEENSSLGTTGKLKFVGAGVTAAIVGDTATVTVPGGGGGGVEDVFFNADVTKWGQTPNGTSPTNAANINSTALNGTGLVVLPTNWVIDIEAPIALSCGGWNGTAFRDNPGGIIGNGAKFILSNFPATPWKTRFGGTGWPQWLPIVSGDWNQCVSDGGPGPGSPGYNVAQRGFRNTWRDLEVFLPVEAISESGVRHGRAIGMNLGTWAFDRYLTKTNAPDGKSHYVSFDALGLYENLGASGNFFWGFRMSDWNYPKIETARCSGTLGGFLFDFGPGGGVDGLFRDLQVWGFGGGEVEGLQNPGMMFFKYATFTSINQNLANNEMSFVVLKYNYAHCSLAFARCPGVDQAVRDGINLNGPLGIGEMPIQQLTSEYNNNCDGREQFTEYQYSSGDHPINSGIDARGLTVPIRVFGAQVDCGPGSHAILDHASFLGIVEMVIGIGQDDGYMGGVITFRNSSGTGQTYNQWGFKAVGYNRNGLTGNGQNAAVLIDQRSFPACGTFHNVGLLPSNQNGPYWSGSFVAFNTSTPMVHNATAISGLGSYWFVNAATDSISRVQSPPFATYGGVTANRDYTLPYADLDGVQRKGCELTFPNPIVQYNRTTNNQTGFSHACTPRFRTGTGGEDYVNGAGMVLVEIYNPTNGFHKIKLWAGKYEGGFRFTNGVDMWSVFSAGHWQQSTEDAWHANDRPTANAPTLRQWLPVYPNSRNTYGLALGYLTEDSGLCISVMETSLPTDCRFVVSKLSYVKTGGATGVGQRAYGDMIRNLHWRDRTA